MAIHRFLHHEPDLIWSEPGARAVRPAGIVTDFEMMVEHHTIGGWLVESDRSVKCREPYDEDAIAKHCVVEGSNIRIQSECSATPIQVAVSLTKQLHNQILPPTPRRWIIAKLDLRRLLTARDASVLQVRLKDNLHNRLTRSELVSGGDVVGLIYFSLVRR
jgi:hypothetical protein